jgi:rhamnogalacturonyl hydrolase YesR
MDKKSHEMKTKIWMIAAGLSWLGIQECPGQHQTDASAPLHLMQADYRTPYKIPETKQIIEILDRIYFYLDSTTPATLIDRDNGNDITNLEDLTSIKNMGFQQGDFRLISYEWGVTYSGMLRAGQTSGDRKYTDYTLERLGLFAELYPRMVELEKDQPGVRHPMRSVLHPHALDDAGAICAAMIRAKQTGFEGNLDPIIEKYIDYISNDQFRLDDGTLARNRPMKNSLWLDDLFMSVPALARMGEYSGDDSYFDDAIRQVLQFAERMFNTDRGLFMHAYVTGMEEHPQFHWGRANGWAIMAMIELLDVLPEDYRGRKEVLDLCRKHIRGLADCQSPEGLWHQLLDRNDSYLETSATAIFTYCIAKALNKGYVSARVYGPMVCLAWNAVASKVNETGQVEGTCVGTGMGFDPAFYYYRPVSVYAAHGYGPVMLAGAEMVELLKNSYPRLNDSAIQFYDHAIETDSPIFREE